MNKQSLQQQAMDLLARREHSAYELTNKLVRAGFDHDQVVILITSLNAQNLQNDQRFAENYTRSRANRGFGSEKIRQELMQRGVATEHINDALANSEIDWFSLALTTRCKHFGEHHPDDIKQRAKQQRFLQSKGFTYQQIAASFPSKSI